MIRYLHEVFCFDRFLLWYVVHAGKSADIVIAEDFPDNLRCS